MHHSKTQYYEEAVVPRGMMLDVGLLVGAHGDLRSSKAAPAFCTLTRMASSTGCCVVKVVMDCESWTWKLLFDQGPHPYTHRAAPCPCPRPYSYLSYLSRPGRSNEHRLTRDTLGRKFSSARKRDAERIWSRPTGATYRKSWCKQVTERETG